MTKKSERRMKWALSIGVILGAIVIIGLPELFREFAEYRFLFYGVALILVDQVLLH